MGEYDTQRDKDCKTLEFQEWEECTDPVKDIHVEQIFIHNDFHLNRENNIALLRLNTSVTFTGKLWDFTNLSITFYLNLEAQVTGPLRCGPTLPIFESY